MSHFERGLAAASCCVVAAEGVSAASERRLHLGLGRRSIPHLLLRRAALLYALMPVTDHTLDVLNQRLGGEAIFYGKPHRPIYERAMALAATSICNFGWKARDFRLKGVDGKFYTLADVRGRIPNRC